MTEFNALAVIETINAIDLFNPEVIQPKLNAIRAQVMAQAATLDISTPGNRSALASLAYKVGQSKTFMDKQRVALVGEQKKALKKIDAQGSANWEFLEGLQKEVRKPLTDWEDAEKDRVRAHEAELVVIETSGGHSYPATSDQIQSTIDRVKGYQNRNWEEFHKRAESSINATLHSLYIHHAESLMREAEAAELARLREESAAREQKEREGRIAREATEKAQREAKEREERVTREHAEAAAKAQREVEAADGRARQALRDAEFAVQQERERAAQAVAAEQAATKAREKDKAHKAEVNNQAMAALVGLGISPADAKKVVTALAKGDIPNARMVY